MKSTRKSKIEYLDKFAHWQGFVYTADREERCCLVCDQGEVDIHDYIPLYLCGKATAGDIICAACRILDGCDPATGIEK